MRYKQPYSLYKRGKYYYYRTYTPDGMRTSGISTGCTNKTSARQFCDNLNLSGGLTQTDKTFGAYSLHFYDEDGLYFRDRSKPLSRNTKDNYRKIYRLYLFPYFEKIKLRDINYSELKKFRVHLAAIGLGQSYIVQTMSVLKHIIETAYRDRLISSNPFDFVEKTKVQYKERDAFTLEEVRTLYNSIGDEFSDFILLLALTGLRISEGVGLVHNEIKRSSEGFEYIDLKVQYNRGQIIPVKVGSCRPIPIIPEVKELIGFDPTRLSALYSAFKPIKESFPNYEERLLCFHSLRHFFITSTKSRGIIESKVEKLVGHTLKGMSKVYTNYKAEDLSEVLAWESWLYQEIKKTTPCSTN